MICPKCGKFSGTLWRDPEVHECLDCGVEFRLKAEVARNAENFVFTTLEQVMATRTDCPTGPG